MSLQIEEGSESAGERIILCDSHISPELFEGTTVMELRRFLRIHESCV